MNHDSSIPCKSGTDDPAMEPIDADIPATGCADCEVCADVIDQT
jgi:hypothetical protein